MHSNEFIQDLLSGKENVTDIDFNKLSSVLGIKQSGWRDGKIYYVGKVEENILQLMKDNLRGSAELIELSERDFDKRFPPL